MNELRREVGILEAWIARDLLVSASTGAKEEVKLERAAAEAAMEGSGTELSNPLARIVQKWQDDGEEEQGEG